MLSGATGFDDDGGGGAAVGVDPGYEPIPWDAWDQMNDPDYQAQKILQDLQNAKTLGGATTWIAMEGVEGVTGQEYTHDQKTKAAAVGAAADELIMNSAEAGANAKAGPQVQLQ